MLNIEITADKPFAYLWLSDDGNARVSISFTRAHIKENNRKRQVQYCPPSLLELEQKGRIKILGGTSDPLPVKEVENPVTQKKEPEPVSVEKEIPPEKPEAMKPTVRKNSRRK